MEKYINKIDLNPGILYRTTKLGNKIYKLGNGLKYKEFHPLEIKNNTCPYLREQLELESNIIVFPKRLVIDKDVIAGYITDFVEGETISQINPQININEFLIKIHTAETEIDILSKKGWSLEDIHDQNILVVDKTLSFKIIDTDYYIKHKNYNYEQLLRRNRTVLLNSIIFSLIPKINISKTINNKKIEKYYLLASNGYITTTEFFYHLIETLSRKHEITDIDSIRKSI